MASSPQRKGAALISVPWPWASSEPTLQPSGLEHSLTWALGHTSYRTFTDDKFQRVLNVAGRILTSIQFNQGLSQLLHTKLDFFSQSMPSPYPNHYFWHFFCSILKVVETFYRHCCAASKVVTFQQHSVFIIIKCLVLWQLPPVLL